MVCAPVRSIIPSLKLGDYLSVLAHKPCSISHLFSQKRQGVFIREGSFIIIITICKGFRKRSPVEARSLITLFVLTLNYLAIFKWEMGKKWVSERGVNVPRNQRATETCTSVKPNGGYGWVDGWMDETILRLFNSILVISGRWAGDNERLCAVKPNLRLKISPPKAGLESVDKRSTQPTELMTVNSGTKDSSDVLYSHLWSEFILNTFGSSLASLSTAILPSHFKPEALPLDTSM